MPEFLHLTLPNAKEEVYKENINNIEQLEQKILQVFEKLENDNTLQSVRLSLRA